jgi:hypothetical protein
LPSTRGLDRVHIYLLSSVVVKQIKAAVMMLTKSTSKGRRVSTSVKQVISPCLRHSSYHDFPPHSGNSGECEAVQRAAHMLQHVVGIGYMDHTGCQRPVRSTKRPTRVTRVTHSRGCSIGYVAHTGREQLVCRLQKNQKTAEVFGQPHPRSRPRRRRWVAGGGAAAARRRRGLTWRVGCGPAYGAESGGCCVVVCGARAAL